MEMVKLVSRYNDNTHKEDKVDQTQDVFCKTLATIHSGSLIEFHLVQILSFKLNVLRVFLIISHS